MRFSNRTYLFLIPILILSLFQCEKVEVQPPKDLIPKETFVKLMAELQLVQVMYNLRMDTVRTVAIRDSVLRDYKIDLEQFYESEVYYHHDVVLYQKMLNDAMDMLNEEQSLLMDKQNPKAKKK